MKALLVLVAAFLSLSSLGARATELETLIEQLQKTKNPEGGVSHEAEEIAKKLQTIGPEAIPLLIPLLNNRDVNVREVAAYTLRDIEGLKEEHLDALMEVCRRDQGGWIPPAIASIGTPRAVDFLVEEPLRERETQNQLGWAIHQLGEKAVPRLLQLYKTEDGWDDRLERAMHAIFHDLGPKAAAAVDPLLEIVNDEKAPRVRRIHAMQALGAIGTTAERAVPDLEKEQQDTDPALRDGATGAILRMGSAAAAPIFARQLGEAKDDFARDLILRDIAALHSRGQSAGPAVSKYLTSSDWEVRVGATRTLGYVGYQDSAADLIKLLDCVEDWRVVLSAAEALGRMEVKAALPKLTKVSQDHWYPPVRAAALAATLAIRDGIHPESKYGGDNFFPEFFGYENAGSDMEMLTGEEAKLIKLPIVVTKSEIPKAALANKPKDRSGGRYCGIKVGHGYLVGRDKGEWGGEISFIDSHGKSSTVLEGNTEAIYQTADGVFATTGLAHLTMNGGVIYKLEKDAAGEWQAKQWRTLPGAPRYSRLLKDGRIFVNCYGGMVAVSPNGDIQFLTRNEVLGEPAKSR